jgi:hypothetical protein
LDDYDNKGGAYHGFCAVARPGDIGDETAAALAKFGLVELARLYHKEEIADIAARIVLPPAVEREKKANTTTN